MDKSKLVQHTSSLNTNLQYYLNNSSWYLTDNQQIFFAKVYETKRINETIKNQNLFLSHLITFRMLNVQDQNKATKLIFQKFQNTCEVIISTLPSILELYINCWSLGQDFIKYSDTLTVMGIGSYSFDKFNSFNKILQEQQTKETNLVKPQILQMMKPLFMSYSKQFMTALLSVWNYSLIMNKFQLIHFHLNELFRNMWPTLLTLLISIFKNKQSNQNLVLEALKLVEMISFMQQDEFFLHQWIFIYNYFGIKIQENQGIGIPITPFLYQPYCSNFLFQQYSVDYSKVEQTNVTDLQKREIIIKQIKVDGQQKLEDISLQLCNYLVQLNSIRIYTVNEGIEDLIENHFIQLDQFIYEQQ